jgi:hypothetical protein
LLWSGPVAGYQPTAHRRNRQQKNSGNGDASGSHERTPVPRKDGGKAQRL